MWRLSAIIAIVLAIAIKEWPAMWKDHHWKELAVNASLLLCGATVCTLHLYDIPLPNPSDLIKMLLNPISKAVENFFIQK